MPTKPPKIKRRDKRLGELHPDMRNWFMGDRGMPGMATMMTDDAIKALWLAHADELTFEYAEYWPGLRPELWWKYSAPGHRRKTGGSGDDAHVAMAYAPTYSDGVCLQVNVNPADPPRFQSEAAYLREHDLLFPGELELIEPRDFADDVLEPRQYMQLRSMDDLNAEHAARKAAGTLGRRDPRFDK